MGARLDDTWTWNGSTWTEQHPATSPPVRLEASMAYDSATGEAVLFGGFDKSGPLGGGSPATVLSGSIIAPVPTDKMFTTETVKLLEKAGKQKPEDFEGGETDVLINPLNEQTGIALNAIQTNEEAFEINAHA